MIDHDLPPEIGQVDVSALPPMDLDPNANGHDKLNLFLYNVTPNQGWRNAGLPSHDSAGARLTNPPLALDLHYLLTAYSDKDFHVEILLGYAMQLLHERPVLTRRSINDSLAEQEAGAPADLQTVFRKLAVSGLADQVEQIKIWHQPLSLEEISKLWSAIQRPYRPSVAYQVSMILVEEHRSTKHPLPVSETGRSFSVEPFAYPLIEKILSRKDGSQTAAENRPILAGHHLIIVGRQLRNEETVVRIGSIEVDPPQLTARPSEIELTLPAGLKAGVQSVQVIQTKDMGTPPVPHLAVESNVAAFVLHPQISASPGNITIEEIDGIEFGSADITITFDPKVGKEQRVLLLLNQVQTTNNPPRAYSFQAPDNNGITDASQETEEIVFPVAKVARGTYLARVQVDGAQSPLESQNGQYNQPAVSI